MIRTATVEDADQMARLCEQVLSLHAKEMAYRFKQPHDRPALIAWFEEILARPGTIAFVAAEKGASVGYVYAQEQIRPESEFRHAQRVVMIEHIVVDSACRRQGVGRSLVEKCAQEARQRHADSLELDVWAFNTAAQQFFASNGFADVRQRMIRKLE